MGKQWQVYCSILVGFISTGVLCSTNNTTEASQERNSSYKRILVMHFPQPVRATEPYTYPGPSPAVNIPPRAPDPYPMYVPPNPYYATNLDYQNTPKWCKNIWDRDDCGTKCWMLRKICRNISLQTVKDDSVEGSSSMSYPTFKPLYPYYFLKKSQSSIIYGKTGLSNTYYAQPRWTYSPYYKRPYYPKYPTTNFGLNPQFTYLEGNEQLGVRTTTLTPFEEDITTTESPTTTVKPVGETTTSKPKTKPIRTKGVYAVKVKQNYPPDSEVQTMSPLMFEYDQYANRGYYGDRVYMNAVMPVTDRELRSNEDYDAYDDFDEMVIDP